MSGIEEITKRISVANAESKRLNNERQVNIGKKETLTQQLNDAIKKYNTTYGTSITVDTLNAEIERVSAIKEKEVSTVENILSLIQSGQYEEAKKAAGVVEEPVKETVVVKEQDGTVSSTFEVPVKQVTKEEVEAIKETTVSAPVDESTVAAPPADTPVAPPTVTASNKATLGVPSMVEGGAPTEGSLKKPNLSGIDALDGFVSAPSGNVAPPPVVEPKKQESSSDGDAVAPPPSFDSILSGSAFNL